ncbi:MAG TPA: GTP cyclohydrolase II [Microlunatus sp.]
MSKAPLVRRVATTVLPTAHGLFRLYGYVAADGREHVALASGVVADSEDRPPLVRVHSECLTGDALGSWRCDCGEQLDAALREIGREGSGALVYLRGHEGRGIGLGAKLHAYALQDEGLDTVDANLRLGLPVDARAYDVAAAILADLGIRRIRLLSANPDKSARLTALGVEVVSRHRLPVTVRAENEQYLSTKQARLGHDTVQDLPDVWTELVAGRVPDRSLAGTEAALLERYGSLVGAGRPLRLGQLAQSADGFIASRSGDARHVSGSADREHLHRLRALVDAVVVGVGTVVADDPRLTTRAVDGPSPVRVVLDPAARTPPGAHLLTDRAAPTLWCVGPTAPVRPVGPGVEIVVLPAHPVNGRFEPETVLGELARRGLGRVLVEGGGRTVSAFLAARVLDRLYLTTAPRLIGDGVPGIRFNGSDRLADAVTAATCRFTLGDDLCTVFDFTAAGPSSTVAS